MQIEVDSEVVELQPCVVLGIDEGGITIGGVVFSSVAVKPGDLGGAADHVRDIKYIWYDHGPLS